MNHALKQSVENLPKEILSLPRFIKTRADNPKRPEGSEWQKPENQRHYSELNGTIGFVASTTDDDSLIYTSAKWFNVLHSSEYFCELSNSERGLHIFAKPTAGKFAKGRRELDLGDGAKLEIFFGTTKFCLCTGKPFNCEPQAPIAKDDVADKIFQTVLDAVAEQNKPKAKPARQTQYHTDQPTEQERAIAMLDFIPVAALSRDEWLNIGMALKNNGNSLSDWEQWSRPDSRFKAGECEKLWQGFNRNGLTIATVHDLAQKHGYSEKEFQHEWHATHKTFTKQSKSPVQMDDEETKNMSTEEIISNIRQACEWKHDAKGNRTTIKSTFANIEFILKNDPNLQKLFGRDLFQDSNVLLKKAPWHHDDHTGEQWHDADDAELRNYFRKNYAELENRQRIEDAIVHFANLNAFHPVKEYFHNLPQWDGVKRAEELFIKFLRADDTPYTREVTLNWLTAAVARIFRPGCRYQTALVLQGGQGIGKSYIAERLGGKWYGAMVDNVDDPHAIDALQNIWIGEFKEMSAMRKVDVDNIKSFIERNADNRRGAYERHAKIKMRHCVFIVTVNDSEFLRDQTGNRRFLIIRCNSKMFDYVDGLTDEYISQLWAEVYQRYNELFKNLDDVALGNKLELSRTTKYEAEEIAKGYLQDDGLTTEIKSFLDKPLPPAIIWRLMNKNDRRKFFIDGHITFDHDTLNYRRRAQGGREQDINRDIDEIYKLLKFDTQRDDIQRINFGETTSYRFYGCELREHICAAEIFNECFGTGDKRKAMYRINEVLNKLDGWHLGTRLQKADPEYREQKKPFYRDDDNRLNENEQSANEYPADEFQGKPLEPTETPPFDDDDLPI